MTSVSSMLLLWLVNYVCLEKRPFERFILDHFKLTVAAAAREAKYVSKWTNAGKNHFHLLYLRGVEAPEHIKRARLDEGAVSADVQLTLMGWISMGEDWCWQTGRRNVERQVMKEEVRKYQKGKNVLGVVGWWWGRKMAENVKGRCIMCVREGRCIYSTADS